jgi:hypothetical protein
VALVSLARGLSMEAIMTHSKKVQKTPQGYEIPIPTKTEFERNLKKVAKPNKSMSHSPKK